jgi:PBP1b-binding outer membrane lipoprotein LpoB
MLRVYSLLVAAFLLGGCYTQNKAVKQVNKALGSFPKIVARIALDSFPCNVIKVDTIITHFDTTIEVIYPHFDTSLSQIDTIYGTKKVYVKLPYKTVYITKSVESTAKLTILNASLDSLLKVTTNIKKSNEDLTSKVGRKNKVIYWLIFFIVGLSVPYCFKIVKSLIK